MQSAGGMETGSDLPSTFEGGRRPWPVAWSAVWVGALVALAVGLVIGLIGIAVGAHGTARSVTWSNVKLLALVFNVGGAFFAFVAGGWVAAKIAGIQRSEWAMLHGSIVWLLAVPLLLGAAAFGAAGYLGGWYGGLAGPPVWATPAPSMDPELARGVRDTALATVVALLLGLAGSVIGGWMASGEPMTLTYYRRRRARPERPRMAA